MKIYVPAGVCTVGHIGSNLANYLFSLQKCILRRFLSFKLRNNNGGIIINFFHPAQFLQNLKLCAAAALKSLLFFRKCNFYISFSPGNDGVMYI